MMRGDVVVLDFPFTSGRQSKVRPALIVQSDSENQRLSKTIVAMITGNLSRSGEPTHLHIDPAALSGTGLRGATLVSCINLYTVDQSNILRVIGSLPATTMSQIDGCLKAALNFP